MAPQEQWPSIHILVSKYHSWFKKKKKISGLEKFPILQLGQRKYKMSLKHHIYTVPESKEVLKKQQDRGKRQHDWSKLQKYEQQNKNIVLN